jgi:hypothetical protein
VCRIFKLPNGDVGASAVRPVFVGEKCIQDGKHLLENEQIITLCEEDMKVVSRYQFRRLK